MSTLHGAVNIDNASNAAVCNQESNTHEEIYEYWDADMLRLLREAGMPRRMPPSLPIECVQNKSSVNPQITSPLRGVTYTIRLSKPESIALRANSTLSPKLFWFADNALIGQAEAGKSIAWQPQRAGHYLLRVVDETGQADSREVLVEFVP